MKLTIQGKQCHTIYQVNKIVMENVRFKYFTDFGLANFAISNLKLSKPLNADDLSEGSNQCDGDLLSWKLISRNADSRSGLEVLSHAAVMTHAFSLTRISNLSKGLQKSEMNVLSRYLILLKSIDQARTT